MAGLILTCPLLAMPPATVHLWMPAGGGTLLAIISITAGYATGRSALELFADGLVMGAVTGGVVYLLAKWLSAWSAAAMLS